MSKPVNIAMNISTPDAASFQRSQHQLLARAAASVARRRTAGMPPLPKKPAGPPPRSPLEKLGQAVKDILAGKDEWN